MLFLQNSLHQSMVFLLYLHGLSLYWCRNSYFGFLLIHVWLFHLHVKSSLCAGWPDLPSHTWGWPRLGICLYKGIVLLLCLSEAIWQVESGRWMSDWNLVTSCLGKGLNCLLRQKYHLRYLFIVVNWHLPIFKWFRYIFGFIKFDFGFSMCLYLVSLNYLKMSLLFS